MRNEKGQFVKGFIPWSKINKGKYKLIFSNPILRGERIRQSRIGKHWSEIQRKIMSEAQKGEKGHAWKGGKPKCPFCKKIIGYKAKTCFEHQPYRSRNKGRRFSEETIKKMSEAHKGHTVSEEYKEILRKRMTGSGSPSWKGGISKMKEYGTIAMQKRRARKRNAKGSHTSKQWLALKIKYGFMCLCCKKYEPEIKLTVDHIIPLSRGGSNDISNIQPLCLSCNVIKHTKTINYVPTEKI